MAMEFDFRESGDAASPFAIAGCLLSLAAALRELPSSVSNQVFDRWRQHMETLIGRETYLTLDDEQGMRDMYNEVRRRVL